MRDRIELSADELADLVSNEVLPLRFATRLKLEAQDPDMRSLVLLYLKGVGSKEEELAEDSGSMPTAFTNISVRSGSEPSVRA